jgi:hypothetical protein
MRDLRFKAIQRGGMLKPEHHKLLMLWALKCSEHAVESLGVQDNGILNSILKTGYDWFKGDATTGDARKASVKAIHIARETEDIVYEMVARSVGHAVATAHMADHSPGAGWYSAKAFRRAGIEQKISELWKFDNIPEEIKELIFSTLSNRKFVNPEQFLAL